MYDVFFLSYDEPLAERHWDILKSKHPVSRRVNGINGIQLAHKRCAELSRTSHFFVIDADNEVIDESVLTYKLPEWDKEYVHLWYAKNPVNDLSYGWGGIKLFPKSLFKDEKMKLDMTTSFPLKIMATVGSITHFNVSQFESWRSAFREAVKLTKAQTDEASQWLEIWCNQAQGPYASWVLEGAQAGKKYAERHLEDFDALCLINNYNWLHELYSGLYGEV